MIITQEPNQTQIQLHVTVVHACKIASLIKYTKSCQLTPFVKLFTRGLTMCNEYA